MNLACVGIRRCAAERQRTVCECLLPGRPSRILALFFIQMLILKRLGFDNRLNGEVVFPFWNEGSV